jgi:hypothetical protein
LKVRRTCRPERNVHPWTSTPTPEHLDAFDLHLFLIIATDDFFLQQHILLLFVRRPVFVFILLQLTRIPIFIFILRRVRVVRVGAGRRNVGRRFEADSFLGSLGGERGGFDGSAFAFGVGCGV